MTIPVIIVPGIMGTRLVDKNGRRLWDPNADRSRRNIARLALNPRAAAVEIALRSRFLNLGVTAKPNQRARRSLTQMFRQRGIVNGGHVVWEGGYDNLVMGLSDPRFRASCGQDIKLFVAGYDWRQSNSVSAHLLKKVVEDALVSTRASQVIIVAHSMGGHVARWFCRHLQVGGVPAHRFVRKLLLLGSPIHGASKAYRMLRQSFATADMIADIELRPLNDPLDESIASWGGRTVARLVKLIPSIYELLPMRAMCSAQPDWLQFNSRLAGLRDASNPVQVYRNRITGLQAPRALLDNRDRFDRLLGGHLPASSVVVYSDSEPTETMFRINADKSLSATGGRERNLGDGTVPTFSGRADGNANTAIPRLPIRGVDHGGVANHRFAVRRIQALIAAECATQSQIVSRRTA